MLFSAKVLDGLAVLDVVVKVADEDHLDGVDEHGPECHGHGHVVQDECLAAGAAAGHVQRGQKQQHRSSQGLMRIKEEGLQCVDGEYC